MGMGRGKRRSVWERGSKRVWVGVDCVGFLLRVCEGGRVVGGRRAATELGESPRANERGAETACKRADEEKAER